MTSNLSCTTATVVTSWSFVLLLMCAAGSARAVFLVIKRLERLRASASMAEALSLLLLSGGGQINKELSAYRFLLRREYANVGDPELQILGDSARRWLIAGFALFVVFMLAGVLAQSIFELRCLLPA